MLRKILTLSTALSAVALLTAFSPTPGQAAMRIATPAVSLSPIQLAAYSPLVYRAQVALAQRGFDPGPADGAFGRRTSNAIQAYQRANGMAVTGALDERLVAQLESGQAAPRIDRAAQRSPDRRGRAMTQSQLITQTQADLQRHGYNLTYVGGTLNGETRDAIRDYQQKHGLEVTGQPSEQLLATMRQDSRVDSGVSPPPSQIYPMVNSTPNYYPSQQQPAEGGQTYFPAPAPQQVRCADFLHQGRPGGSDYNGPAVAGCP